MIENNPELIRYLGHKYHEEHGKEYYQLAEELVEIDTVENQITKVPWTPPQPYQKLVDGVTNLEDKE